MSADGSWSSTSGRRKILDPEKHFIIGVDLGTTNSAVSYVDLQADSQKKYRIKIFKVPQLTGFGEVSSLPVLPSFLYIPGKYDISSDAVSLPWISDEKNFVGAFARDHGAKVPARLVSSAKSWLCHSKVDRKARILPWGAGEEVFKISPLEATASYLKHIKKAWNSSKGDDEDLYLENQIIIITVPASFDEVARDLTVEAALIAGLSNVVLLEEPLATFYSWLIRHEHDWNKFVNPNELILVCDVGGGTTDFTLITLREVEGSPRFERIAVGDHLILGGDNVDLALASNIERRLSKKRISLSGDRWRTLCHQCRQAKENILNEDAESEKITLMGEGSKLIAGTVSAELGRKEIEETVLEGFFPLADPKDIKKINIREGITEFGLPYEQEPAITRHLGYFLDKHKKDVIKVLNREDHAPDLILFNGGSLKPLIIREKIRAAIRNWFHEKDSCIPRVLDNPDPDLSVALGASYYGLVKIGKGVRVGSGSARAYYLGVSKKKIETIEDLSKKGDKKLAVCLVERGLEEGTTIELKDKKFEVLANQPVSFDIYSSSFRSGDRCGDLVEIDDSLTSLPPIQTVVQYGKKGVKTRIPVRIESDYTEMGTLALWCRSLISNHRWKLQFQLRDALTLVDITDKEIFEDSIVDEVRSYVGSIFSDRTDSSALKSISKIITKKVGRSRERWPLGFIRRISDELIKLVETRTLGPEHESRWLNLTGFCMRPGFGDGFDEYRVKSLWKIHKHGAIHSKNAQVCSEWWIFWRRVAGGLSAGQQRQFIQELSPIIMPKKGTKSRVPHQERLEIWMAVANMERLLVKDKIQWGRMLLSEIKPQKCKPQYLWSLSRIGARELLYGPVDRVIPPEEISSWIEEILSKTWRNPKPVGMAIAQLARKTDDRMRDLDSSIVNVIIDWMNQYDILAPHIKFLEDVVPMAKSEENAIFGETLPSGLVLH
ncbi:MAG: hsp70 family protein [Actinomycetia bacterium]|nr:hsp70 family protein [Actinomycetes bacterium]